MSPGSNSVGTQQVPSHPQVSILTRYGHDLQNPIRAWVRGVLPGSQVPLCQEIYDNSPIVEPKTEL
jgi:hypothetical protein